MAPFSPGHVADAAVAAGPNAAVTASTAITAPRLRPAHRLRATGPPLAPATRVPARHLTAPWGCGDARRKRPAQY